MQDIDYQNIKNDISIARMSSYQHFFKTNSVQEVYSFYCWNEAVSASLFRLIGIIEITLRNKIHTSLSQECYCNLTSTGTHKSNDWFNKINLNYISQDKIKKETHKKKKNGNWVLRNPHISHDDVIARMTYGFWPKLLDTTKKKRRHPFRLGDCNTKNCFWPSTKKS